MRKYIAIDIGGTNIKYGLIDDTDTLLEAHEIPTEAHKGGPEILRKVKGIVASYLEQTSVAGICISSAGMVDPDKGEIFYAGPQIPNYAGTQFKKVVEETFAVPCEIGAFQDVASTTALVNYVAELHGEDPTMWNGRRIFKEATEGNARCIQGIDRMVNYLGQGIANICYVVNPEVVILGGGIMGQEAILRPRIETAMKACLVPSIAEKTKLAFAHHQNAAGMFGAYYHFKNKHH